MSGSDSDPEQYESAVREANRKKKRSGGFQSMGLSHTIAQAIQRKGYRVPTPIQRKVIPIIMGVAVPGQSSDSAMKGRDVVAMARTGSGKSAAFIIPMLERLKTHSARMGTRALILSPARELCMQTAQFTRELSKGTDLRTVTIVGGDSIDEQFAMIASNPDIIVATPGRLMHLLVELPSGTDFLKTVEYLVFDEADRLFELGFMDAINEIVHKLSPNRQTLLFSATLPKSLVEFAKAGLQQPVLVRLDTDHKISPELELVFLGVKQAHKEVSLMYLVKNIIKSTKEQTIIFTSTKHHVEYLHELLSANGIKSSYIYGSLDQAARLQHIGDFRAGKTQFLVVTDLAARGIDIPFLNNVVHYDFTDKAKLFVHRAGRAARAGRSGVSYALVTNDDLAHLIDLQLFLGRAFKLGSEVTPESAQLKQEIIYAGLPEVLLQDEMEVLDGQLKMSHNLQGLQKSSKNGYQLYKTTRSQASKESYIRARRVVEIAPLASGKLGVHPILHDRMNQQQLANISVLDSLRNFRPHETIFEIKKMGMNKGKNSDAASDLMKYRRTALNDVIAKKKIQRLKDAVIATPTEPLLKVDNASEIEIDGVFEDAMVSKKRKRTSDITFRDEEYYISHVQEGADTERSYAVNDLQSPFLKQAATAQMDIAGDDDSALKRQAGMLKWDKRSKKFVRQGQVGADNKKMIRTESGALVPASYKTKAYEQWQKKSRTTVLQAGEREQEHQHYRPGKKFKHTGQQPAKALDPLSINYERKLKMRKKDGKPMMHVQDEVKNRERIVSERKLLEKRKEKNARPSGSSKYGGGRGSSRGGGASRGGSSRGGSSRGGSSSRGGRGSRGGKR